MLYQIDIDSTASEFKTDKNKDATLEMLVLLRKIEENTRK